MLERLLAAWRETHDPALEEPIARLGDLIARQRPAIAAKTKRELEVCWHAIAERRDPADLDRLLDTPWPKREAQVEARLHALLQWPPDPRFGPKLLRLRGHYLDRALDGPIGAVLALSPSAKLEALLEGYNEHRFGRARAALAQVTRTKCDPTLLEHVPGIEAPRVDLEAASLANPDDLALRRVLADQLQEAGDPRGEFIALQLAIADGSADKRAQPRLDALLAANIDRWIEPLPNVQPTSCRFDRGFLVAFTSTARGRVLDASIERPEWRVVEELTIDGRDADVAALLRRMPRLRMLVTRDEVLARLAREGPFPAIRALGTPSQSIAKLREAFPDVAVIAGQWVRRWQPDALAANLRGLHHAIAASDLDALVHVKLALDEVPSVLAERGSGARETRFTVTLDAERGWIVAVARDAPHVALMWGGGPPRSRDQIETLLVQLAAAGLREVSVHVDARAQEAVEYTLRNRKRRLVGVTVTFDGPPIDLSAPISPSPR